MTAVRDFYKDYKLINPIAEGGMGLVLLAEDNRANNAKCVIKQMRKPDAQTQEELDEARRLFTREVEILSDLDHPGIVKFRDYYVDTDDRYFLVMDYITGNTLETILHNYGPFSEEDTVMIGIQICEVLEYLHDDSDPNKPSILYRDLKPSNLMLTPEGNVIFIDFGIARFFMPSTNATRVVTAGYSPPEQYFGRPEVRSDLYALGATLAHLVTGVRPRPLVTSNPSQQDAEVHQSFNDLIMQLTAHSPAERPASARVVKHNLFKIYQEIHPDFEIPEEVFHLPSDDSEDQFVSQKIMKTGLQAASSASKNLPAKRGPGLESFSDDDMPTSIQKVFENLNKQRVSSAKVPKFDSSEQLTPTQEKAPNRVATKESLATTKNLRDTMDRHHNQGNIWQRFIKWVTGRS